MHLLGKHATAIAATAVTAVLALTACGSGEPTTSSAAAAAISENLVEKTARATYSCNGIPGIEDIDVTIAAPDTVVKGETATLKVTALKNKALPFDSPADSIRVKVDLLLGGASSGSTTAVGLRNLATPANEPVRLVGGKAQVKLNDVGDVTFSPGNLYSPVAQCLVQGTAPAAVTIHVVAG